jgi:biopolymer transport protein ExbB
MEGSIRPDRVPRTGSSCGGASLKYILGVDFYSLMTQGGFFMWPILLTAIIAAALSLERLFYVFFRAHVNARVFMTQIERLLLLDNLDRAIKLCNAEPGGALPQVVKAGLMHAGRPKEEIEAAVDEAILEVSPALARRTGYLPMLANISTLMGLLGTIAGLILAFDAVANAPAEDKQRLLAVGIAVAMYTTAGGLLVAIPILVAHGLISQTTNRILDEVDQYSAKLLNLLAARQRATAERPPAAEIEGAGA